MGFIVQTLRHFKAVHTRMYLDNTTHAVQKACVVCFTCKHFKAVHTHMYLDIQKKYMIDNAINFTVSSWSLLGIIYDGFCKVNILNVT